MISIECPTCFKTYNVQPELIDKRVKCKACGTRILIEEPGSHGLPEEEVSGSWEADAGEPAVSGVFADVPCMSVEMKKCDECGAWIKYSASVCQHCNRRSGAENRPRGNRPVPAQNEMMATYGRPAIAIAIVVIDALLLMAWAAQLLIAGSSG